MTMGRDEARLWRLLSEQHRGRASAIKEADVARRFGWETRAGKPDTRRVQHALRALRLEHGKLIDAACSKPYGLYVCVTDQEVDGYLGQLESRAREAWQLFKAAKGDAKNRDQGELGVGMPAPSRPRPEPRGCRFCGAASEGEYCSDFHEQLDTARRQKAS